MENENTTRFQNTRSGLVACKATIETMINKPSRNAQLQIYELAAAKELVGMCFEVSRLLTDYAAIDIEHTSADDMGKILDMINVRCALNLKRCGDE